MINLGVLQVVLKAKDQLSGKIKSVAAVAIAAGVAIAKFTKDTIDLGARLVDLRSQTGVTIQALQEFEFAGKQAGVGMKVISDSVLRLGRRSAAELPETVKWLKNVGLSVEDITSSDPAAAFELVASKLEAMGPGAQQAAAAMGILGDAGLQVLPAINQGLTGNIERFRELGVAMSDEAAQQAKELGDTITDLEARWMGMKMVIGNAVIPALRNIVIFFGDLLPGAIQTVIAKQASFTASLVETFQTAAAAIAIFSDSFVGVADNLGNTAAKLRDFAAGAQAAADANFASFGASISESMDVAVVATDMGTNSFFNMSAAVGRLNFDAASLSSTMIEWDGSIRQASASARTWGTITSQSFDQTALSGETFGVAMTGVGDLVAADSAAMAASFANFGLQTRSQFASTEAQAVRDFAAIKKSGEFTAKQLDAIWTKYEQSRQIATATTTSFTLTSGAELASGVAGQLQQLGGKNKAFSLSQAIINTALAVTKALTALPFPANLPAAAGAAIAGGVQIATIASQSGFRQGTPDLDFQSFGPSSNAVLHGNEAVIPQGGGHQLAGEIAEAGGGGQTFNITIEVEGFGSLESAAQDLAPVLVRALKDDSEFQRVVGRVANG